MHKLVQILAVNKANDQPNIIRRITKPKKVATRAQKWFKQVVGDNKSSYKNKIISIKISRIGHFTSKLHIFFLNFFIKRNLILILI